MSSLSTHVLDTERGVPAAGVSVTLHRDDQTLVATARTDPSGRVSQLATDLDTGTYRLVFDVGAYLGAQGRTAPFLQRVSIDVRIDDHQSHYHVPLLVTPFACTAYRGS